MSYEIDSQTGGWIAAAALALWGVLLRTMLGRHYKAQDETNQRLSYIEKELAQLRGRFEERDRTGGKTSWPGGCEYRGDKGQCTY